MDKILVKEVIAPIIIVFCAIVLCEILQKISKKILLRNTKFGDIKKKKTLVSLVNNLLKYVIAVIALLMILEIFGIDTKAIITSLGVGVAVIGLALQDLLKDFVSGIFIVFENQFSVGDWVTVNDFKGEVISIGLKSTRVKSYTGEVKIIANRLITEVVNHTMKNDIALVDVSVSYDEDLDFVEEVLNQLFEKLNNEISELTGKITILGVDDLGESGIVYKIAAPCKPVTTFTVQRYLRKTIKQEFDKNHITIPYNQVVIHNE